MRLIFTVWCMCVAMYLADIGEAAEPYHGKLIGTLTTLAHGVTGKVYAVDDKHIRIIGFTYDGTAPDAFFWAGNTASPDTTGTIIPDENGRSSKLSAYSNEDITLALPGDTKITEYKWIAVWCRQFTANFGQVIVPNNIVPPAELDIGEFRRRAHGLRGHVYIVNAKTFRIENLHYDGNGPDAYFWVGVDRPSRLGTKVPDEKGRTGRLYGYSGQTISITLADDLTVFDIDWLSMWCIRFRENFGEVIIPENPNVPPYLLDTQAKPDYVNCMVLDENLHMSWTLGDDYIDFELSGPVDFGEYLSFGLSGSDTASRMVGADVTVVWNDATTGPMAVDYDLSAKAQCSQEIGACPDTETGGTNDVSEIRSHIKDGVVRIGYRRLLNTSDPTDKVIVTDRDVYIVWAIGQINNNGVVAKHHTIPSGDVQVNFGGPGGHYCSEFVAATLAPVKAWDPIYLRGDEDHTEFTVRIGQTGGRRGYTAITGQVAWGIAWYINEKLIPVVELKPGMNYTFLVEGGDDPDQSAQYHPFYITDDPIGGYAQKTPQQRQDVEVFAGVEFDGNGDPYPTAAGRYCEYVTNGVDQSEQSETFDEYFKTLSLDCQPGQPAELKWTPQELGTYYYQCYTHQFLGWKIEVVNEFSSSAGFPYVTPMLLLLSLLFSLMLN